MKKTIALILSIVACLVITLPNFVSANDIIQTDKYSQIYTNTGNDGLKTAGGKVLGVARVIGVAAGVICLIVLAVKYMMMSSNADNKASIKEKLIPYLIGAVLLFAGSGILSIIAKVTQSIKQ